MNCNGLISEALSTTCKSHAAGFERVGMLFNRADINFGGIVYDVNDPNIITTMPLSSTKVGYKVVQYGTKPFSGTKKSGVIKETSINKITKTVQFFVPDKSPETDLGFIEPIMQGEFVAILENKDKNETDMNTAFEIFGLNCGLHCTALEQDTYGDYGSGWLVTLEETEASSASLYLFDTSYSATKTKFDGYLTPVP